jgi:DUF1365 family protein
VELLRSVFALPLVTLKIVAAIHWEALRLWLKGVRLVPRYEPPPVPTWRSAKATIILCRRCLPAARIEAMSIDHGKPG